MTSLAYDSQREKETEVARIKKALITGAVILALIAAGLVGYTIGTHAIVGAGTLLSNSFRASFTPLVFSIFMMYILASIFDIGTGLIKAHIKGTFTSKEMRIGIWKKAANTAIVVVTILVNGVFHLLGIPIGTWLVLGVIVPLFAMEIGSILENLGEAGVPIPNVLKKALKILNDKGNADPPDNVR